MFRTIFGEYFRPYPMHKEIIYYICTLLAAVLICQNLYLAVRVLWKPKRPKDANLSRSRAASRYLARAAIAAAAAGLIFLTLALT